MDGVETTRRIRAAYLGIAILALSSSDDPGVRDGFLWAGADAVIDKRDMRRLLAAVRAVEDAHNQPGRSASSLVSLGQGCGG